MLFFKTIGCFFHPHRSAGIIKNTDTYIARFESRMEKALVARMTGTYIKAYDAAYSESYVAGTREGRRLLIAQLKAASVKLPEGIE